MLLCRRHHRAIHEEGFTVELDSSGEASFRRPGGRPLLPVPPPPLLPPDPLAELVADHRQLGLEIVVLTVEAAAGPGPFDLRMAIDWLVAVEAVLLTITRYGEEPAAGLTLTLPDGTECRETHEPEERSRIAILDADKKTFEAELEGTLSCGPARDRKISYRARLDRDP